MQRMTEWSLLLTRKDDHMYQSRVKYAVLGVVTICFLLNGCTTILMEAGKKAMEDRSTEDQSTDTTIASSILSDLMGKDESLVLDVNVDVWEQRVLLTGTLDDKKVRDEVVKLVKADTRIKAVYDEIQIVTPEEKERRRKEAEKHDKEDTEGMEQTVDDIWIATKIEAQLVSAGGVTSVNYRWRSVRNQVYLIGRSRSQAELDKVLQICRTTEGVSSVKHFVEIKPPSS